MTEPEIHTAACACLRWVADWHEGVRPSCALRLRRLTIVPLALDDRLEVAITDGAQVWQGLGSTDAKIMHQVSFSFLENRIRRLLTGEQL